MIGVNLQLFDGATQQASLTGLQACWWDVLEPKDMTRPIGKAVGISTDASGFINLDLSNVTGLTIGDFGFLAVYKLDGTDHEDSLVFSGRVVTSDIVSGTDMYYYDSGWTRPASWLEMEAPLATDQQFIGLHEVGEENANFVALSAEGAYVINWGDGTGNQNVASGVTAQTNILWANAPATSDVGIADAVACTFTDTGDTVGVTGHTFKNGEKVAFDTIVTTTGINIHTSYWVVDAATDTFGVAATQGGEALVLTGDGTGTVYRPKYRQVIVSLTMQAAQNLTKLTLHLRNTTTGLQIYASGFLDIALAGSLLTDLRLGDTIAGTGTKTINFDKLEQINIVRSNLKQCERLCSQLIGLRHIVDIATSTDAASTAAVTFQDTGDTVTHTAHGRIHGESVMFSAITSTTGILVGTRYFILDVTADTYKVALTYTGAAINLVTNGSGTAVYGTNFSLMFSGCSSLTSIPLLNTAAGTTFNSMFSSCPSLTSIPLLNTVAGINFTSMFQSCSSLISVPLLNTAAGTTFANMFFSCHSLTSAPLLNTVAGTNFSGMFTSCSSLTSIPLLNTVAGINFTSMFQGCSALTSIPLLNTAAGESFSSMFQTCYALTSIPLLNTAASTNFSSMFRSCSSLTSIPLLNTAAGNSFFSMFNTCTSLTSIPLLNTAAGNSFSSMFQGCSSLEVGALSGTAVAISYANCKLSGAELNRIYSNLAVPEAARTITVTNNWGTATDNPALVPAGWTVSGS